MPNYPIPAGATEVSISDPIFIIPPPPPVNLPPSADAGQDTAIVLPNNSVSLKGRGLDPEGNAVSFTWNEKTSSGATIVSPHSANTDVTGFTTPGTFIFMVTVTDDKGLTKTDDVNVTVNPAPIVVPTPPSIYEGFGRAAISALIFPVTEVRSKSDFDKAVQTGNRIVRFMTALKFIGRYELQNIANLFIDGNGFDITIDNNNNGVGISVGQGSHHIIVGGIRVINAGDDGINVVDNAHDVIIDHCSAYDNRDGNIDIAATSGQNVTMQNCFVGRGGAGWSGDTLVTCKNVSLMRNLFAPFGTGVGERCPLVHASYSPVGSPNADIRNNLVYKWDRQGGGNSNGVCIAYWATANVVNNYFIPGAQVENAILIKTPYGTNPTGIGYAAGNVQHNSIKNLNSESNHAEYIISDPYKITMLPALDAAKKITGDVGTAVKTAYEKSILDAINSLINQ